ncbi:MAG: hypothetical protein P4N60_19135 [Verrucomicrobiae bacterium]|nr:hypothetical protein [Verrucomicrobiae bacterium]
MKSNAIICDGCEKPIDPKLGSLEFRPLRGGLSLVITDQADAKGNAPDVEHTINQHVHLHPGIDCFGLYIGNILKADEAAKKPTPEAPASPARTSNSAS